MMEGFKRNVVLFEREDVRLAENGDVFTGTLSEISQIKQKPGRFKTEINFRRYMTSDEVRIVLEEKFPLLQNRRFSCAARAGARLDFYGVRRVWDGNTISKLRGNSALYLVMEDEVPVSRQASCGAEYAFSMKANVEHESNNDARIPLSLFVPGSFDIEELMEDNLSHFPTGNLDFDEMDSIHWNSQSENTQGNAASGNFFSNHGWTDPTSSPITHFQNGASETRSTCTDTGGPPESGFSSEGNSSVDGQAGDLPHSIPPQAGVDVKPSKGPLEGGGVFQLRFDQSLPDAVTSAWASFGEKKVEVWKTYECSLILYGESIPAGEVPGTVPVTVTSKDGVFLGTTQFTYVDHKKDILKQMVQSKKLQGEFFIMLGRQCENDESEENNTRGFGLPSDGQQRRAMDILRCLVYTAAEIGAEEFIQMIFSTSAGRIVFEAYKKESSLPEDMADANGYEDIAAFLRAITKRFSEEDTTSQMRSEGINWHELARACEEKEEQSVSWPCETDVKQLKESESEYFGDAETSSSDSEKERCDYEDQFEARFSKDHDPIHLGLDPSYQMTERDIYHYQLAEKIRDKWRDLARALKYTKANIDSIEKEQGTSSIKECCIEVLVCWMRREGPSATVKELASALSKVELRNVADELMCMDTTQIEIKDKQQGDEEENKTANEPAGSSTDNSNTTQTRKQDDGFDQVDAAAVINQPAPDRIVQLQDGQGESQPAVEEHKETNFKVPEIEVTLSITQSSSSSDEDSTAWEERKKKKSRKNKRAGNGQKNDDEKDEVNKLARENETTKNSIDNLKKEKSSLEENLEEERVAIKPKWKERRKQPKDLSANQFSFREFGDRKMAAQGARSSDGGCHENVLDDVFERYGPIDAFIDLQFNNALRGEEELYSSNQGETRQIGSKVEVRDMEDYSSPTLQTFTYGTDTQINLDHTISLASPQEELESDAVCPNCRRAWQKDGLDDNCAFYGDNKVNMNTATPLTSQRQVIGCEINGGIEMREETSDPRKSVVTEMQLSDISDDVGTCWRELGLKLSIAAAKIYNVDEEYSHNRDKAYACLNIWRMQVGSGALAGHLADALESIGRKSIAEKLLGVSDVKLPACTTVSEGHQLRLTVKCDLDAELDNKLMLCEDDHGNKYMLKAVSSNVGCWNSEEIQKNKTFLETVAVAAQAMGKTTEQRRQESLKRISSEVQELRQQLKRVKLDSDDVDLDLHVSDGAKSCPQGDVQSKKETVYDEHLSAHSLQGESLQQLLKSCDDQRSFCQGIYGALIELVGEVGQLPREDNAKCIRQLYDFTKELQDQEKTLFSKIEQLACCQCQQSNDLQATQVKKLDKWKRTQKEQVEGVEKLLLSLLNQWTMERRESHGKMEKSQKLLNRRSEPIKSTSSSSGLGRRRAKTELPKNHSKSQNDISSPVCVHRMCVVDTNKKLKKEKKVSP